MSRASDKCQREKRKTINGDDLLWAMATLGFEDYIDPLKVYLTRYREVKSIFFCLFTTLSIFIIKSVFFWSSLTYSVFALCSTTWKISDGGQWFFPSPFLETCKHVLENYLLVIKPLILPSSPLLIYRYRVTQRDQPKAGMRMQREMANQAKMAR